MGFRSPNCASRSTGKPLMAYQSKVEAQGCADHLKNVLGKAISSYQCSRCQLWHLKPSVAERETFGKCCYCQARDGTQKVSYPTQEEAERQADRLSERSFVTLRAYCCPHTSAWHLTSRR